MHRLRDPFNARVLFVLGLLLLSMAFYFLPKDQKNIVNYFTLAGTYTSVVGIIIAYLQILSIRQTAEITQGKVDESIKKIHNTLSISDLSKAIKLVHEIQNYIKYGQKESAILRMKDLKSILIQLKYNDSLKYHTAEKAFGTLLGDLSINLTNLTGEGIGTKTGAVDTNKILSDLEKIETQLSEFEGQLKFGSNGSD